MLATLRPTNDMLKPLNKRVIPAKEELNFFFK